MPPTRALSALARSRLISSTTTTRATSAALSARFSTSAPRPATTEGAPTKNFRLQRPRRWDEPKESLMDQAGNYFLLTEMMRGMWVLLEQFFRPP
jgi:NADH dehydrogenase (ubiquinone) Fe-S protein 8